MNFTTALDHRGGMNVASIRPAQTMLARIATESQTGHETVSRITNGLYDGIEGDALLRPLFLKNLAKERENQKDFWVEWLGGEPNYTHHHSYDSLRLRHANVYITRESAEQWLLHLETSLMDAIADAGLVQEILAVARPMALSLVNESKLPENLEDLRCRRDRPFRDLRTLAERGRTAELLAAMAAAPSLQEDATMMAGVLHRAAMKGRTETVEALMTAGVDPNRAAPYKEGLIFQHLMLTPLCVALLKKHEETAACLTTHGAVYDIFTAAYLGNVEVVTQLLDAQPALANAEDPANDLLQTTPLFHSVMGRQRAVVERLFTRGSVVGKNSTVMVKFAANHGEADILNLLLMNDAGVTRIGPGDWVLKPTIAKLLLDTGADVNYPDGEWIKRACTGNHGQQDNPKLIRALLTCGANIHTRLRGATALHYTAKANFFESTRLLLAEGADPNAVDEIGETPLFYALKAGKRADIAGMCETLIAMGANPQHVNHKGVTPFQAAKRSRRADKDVIMQVLTSAPLYSGE
ncbi:MAG: ankyrin repeat domain-containing protein [Chloroflexota bacterium]